MSNNTNILQLLQLFRDTDRLYKELSLKIRIELNRLRFVQSTTNTTPEELYRERATLFIDLLRNAEVLIPYMDYEVIKFIVPDLTALVAECEEALRVNTLARLAFIDYLLTATEPNAKYWIERMIEYLESKSQPN